MFVTHTPVPTVSCVICAYNEADRIGAVLEAVVGHPMIDEIIVVDDGSTDGTGARVRAFPSVRLISVFPNAGKTRALARGIAAATSDYVMLLDADLEGLTVEDIDELATPVLDGEADISISLRGDTLPVYRALKLDFVSGERVLPRAMFAGAAEAMARLPRWGGEVFINELIIAQGLRVAVVDWPDVNHTPKHRKAGWRGVAEEFRMVGDALKVLSPGGVVRQNMALRRLSR
jgi:glycosyltransferase involved in cell wall biosynthesis